MYILHWLCFFIFFLSARVFIFQICDKSWRCKIIIVSSNLVTTVNTIFDFFRFVYFRRFHFFWFYTYSLTFIMNLLFISFNSRRVGSIQWTSDVSNSNFDQKLIILNAQSLSKADEGIFIQWSTKSLFLIEG